MPNEVTDVWAQAKIIRPESVPKYFKHAQELLMNRVSQFVLIPKPGAVEAAFKMLQPSVRYALDAVVELPEVIASTVDVPMSSTQAKAYKALAAMFKAEVEGKQIVALNAAVAMGKLLQVAGGWVYGGGVTIPLDAKQRQDALVDLINENERKVIVMVPFRHAIEGLACVFDAAKVDYAIVHGGIGGRDEIFNHFQNSTKYKVLLAHPECLAHGLTLTAADTIIWYMPITSLDIYEQANARITRVGQKHKQKIIHLQSTPVEKRIYTLLRSKQKVQDSLLAMLSEATDGRKVSGL
jgi:SNF2 family DNA or RNA helicase